MGNWTGRGSGFKPREGRALAPVFQTFRPLVSNGFEEGE